MARSQALKNVLNLIDAAKEWEHYEGNLERYKKL